MALIEINLNPSQRELRWFGLLMLVFFLVFGQILSWVAGWSPVGLWITGAVICVLYYAVPPIRRTSYLAWMYAVLPIGWTISHLLFAAIYFLAITPMGFLMRLTGRDPLTRHIQPEAKTYWVPRKVDKDLLRYFWQF